MNIRYLDSVQVSLEFAPESIPEPQGSVYISRREAVRAANYGVLPPARGVIGIGETATTYKNPKATKMVYYFQRKGQQAAS
jgi:hypothetical protein